MAGVSRQIYKVFVGNISWTIGSQELKAFATKFGSVNGAHVVFDKNTGMSKGYGFILFADKEAAQQATLAGAGGHFLEGQYLNIQPILQSNRHNNE